MLNGSNLGSTPKYSANPEVHEEDPVVNSELLEEVAYPDLVSQADQDDDDIDVEQPKGDAEGKGEEDDHYLSEDAMEGVENDDIWQDCLVVSVPHDNFLILHLR